MEIWILLWLNLRTRKHKQSVHCVFLNILENIINFGSISVHLSVYGIYFSVSVCTHDR